MPIAGRAIFLFRGIPGKLLFFHERPEMKQKIVEGYNKTINGRCQWKPKQYLTRKVVTPSNLFYRIYQVDSLLFLCNRFCPFSALVLISESKTGRVTKDDSIQEQMHSRGGNQPIFHRFLRGTESSQTRSRSSHDCRTM